MEIYMNENIQADALDRFGVTTSEFISWLSPDLGHVVTIIVQFDTCNWLQKGQLYHPLLPNKNRQMTWIGSSKTFSPYLRVLFALSMHPPPTPPLLHHCLSHLFHHPNSAMRSCSYCCKPFFNSQVRRKGWLFTSLNCWFAQRYRPSAGQSVI